MKRQTVHDTLLEKLTLLDTDDVNIVLSEISQTKSLITIGFLNQHAYNLANQNIEFYNSIIDMDYLFRDGIGIKLACLLNNLNPALNLNGTDFIKPLIEKIRTCSSQPIQYFAMGTSEPWLSQGSAALLGTQLTHNIHGFYDEDAYIEFFKEKYIPKNLAVVILAMGMPKQEHIAERLKSIIGTTGVIICGGAILDFAAHRIDRAPSIMRKSGLEWLYRFYKEPRRLFRRYAIGIPLFFFYALKNRFNGSP
jgi:beta-1,4-glucosyltransferase